MAGYATGGGSRLASQDRRDFSPCAQTTQRFAKPVFPERLSMISACLDAVARERDGYAPAFPQPGATLHPRFFGRWNSAPPTSGFTRLAHHPG